MLRTSFIVGCFALAGLLMLRLAFGILPALFSMLFWALGAAIKVAVLGFVVYGVIRLVRPEKARQIRSRIEGALAPEAGSTDE